MEWSDFNETISNKPHTLFDKIRKHTFSNYIALTLGIAGIISWLSSCSDKKSEIAKLKPTVKIIAKDKKVDITWWSKMIEMEWNTLKIGEEIVAKWDKECQIRIEYENDQSLQKENLEWKFLEKPWKIYIYLTTNIDPELTYVDELESLTVKDSLILYTTQESLVSWVNGLRNILFKVGEPINLMNYIKLHNVSLEKITITYPGQQEVTIDNPYNFIPERPWKRLTLKIYVNRRWETSKCITDINIYPRKREPITPSLWYTSAEDVFPNLSTIVSNKDFQYIKQTWVIEGHQMIQTMLHHGTTNFSQEEYKKHLDKVVIILTWEGSNWNDETVFNAIIPFAKLKTITSDDNNNWASKTIKYAHEHPEEIIIVHCPWNTKENEESNELMYIEELNKLDNIVLIKNWGISSAQIAIIWMTAQLDPYIKNANDLKNIILPASNNDTNSNGTIKESISIPNISWIIKKKLVPNNIPFYLNLSDNNSKYDLQKWEYPFIIFDIPWAMMEYNWDLIPYDKENSYILNNIDLSKCNRSLDKGEILRLWYTQWDVLKWNVIILDENWKKFKATKPISIELK